MRWNVVEIAENGRYIKLYRGFLLVKQGDTELGKVIIDEMCCLLLTSEQATLSKPLMVELANNGIPIVICGENYHPISITLPYSAHHQSTKVLNWQLIASEPLKKRLWQAVVKEKLINQAKVLAWLQPDNEVHQKQFSRMIEKIKSGDTSNIETQAAKYYWKVIDDNFSRNSQSKDVINSALNYGYTVMRAACARAIVAAGLLPALGIYHSNQNNAFCLADDLMEVYRPLVDYEVFKKTDLEQVTPDLKRNLAKLLQYSVRQNGKGTIVNNSMQNLAFSLANSFESKAVLLNFPNLE